MKNGKPIVGLTSSYGTIEERELVFLPSNYLGSIRHFGGIPLLLPAEASDEELEFLINQCDGILLTGGDDIDPTLYGETVLNDTVVPAPLRDKMEAKVCRMAVDRGLPMLGICRGIQMMNVYFGGTLYQDIPGQLETDVRHSMEKPYHRSCHTCDLVPGTPLSDLTGEASIGVNSHHHQAVKAPAPGFQVMARCPDSVIEAIYDPSADFRWGIQWHPERIWDIEPSSAKVFEAFLEACKK